MERPSHTTSALDPQDPPLPPYAHVTAASLNVGIVHGGHIDRQRLSPQHCLQRGLLLKSVRCSKRLLLLHSHILARVRFHRCCPRQAHLRACEHAQYKALCIPAGKDEAMSSDGEAWDRSACGTSCSTISAELIRPCTATARHAMVARRLLRKS